MAKFRIDKIGELSRQMAFTPQDARAAQLGSAEELLLDIDPGKAYPFDFIVFRITGYHPRHVDQDLITGLALQHDLGLLIEQVSETLNLRSCDAGPALMIDEVTERFNVTSKTIQRWRRRGLAARRFIFPDGKRRMGFLPSTVERFVAAHRDQVAAAANFSQVSEIEKTKILRHARRLAERCRCCAHEISRRIARKLDRSPLTVMHLIRTHDSEHPESAIFPHAAQAIDGERRSEILRSALCGLTVRAIARRMCLSRSVVYRVILEDRLGRLNRRKAKFIDDPLYHQPNAGRVIDEIVSQESLPASAKPEETRIPRDLPPYLRDLYRTPLLSPARERALFLKLNFHKFEFVTARRQLPGNVHWRDLHRLEAIQQRVADAKNNIVRANLRLVVSVARKHLRAGLSLMELISDGNITLMRAVDSFDIHKGNRFSTYATLALMKGFARSVPQMMFRGRAGVSSDATMLASLPDRNPPMAIDRMLHRDEVGQLLDRLEPRERDVLRAHYGLAEGRPATLEQVGKKMGLSKQRVRQIEQIAIAKLRAAENLEI